MTLPVYPRHTFTFLGTTHHVFHADTGKGLPRHEHDYAHVTAVHSGSLLVRKEGLEMVLTKNDAPILLKANQWHELEALEDGTVFENVFPFGAAPK